MIQRAISRRTLGGTKLASVKPVQRFIPWLIFAVVCFGIYSLVKPKRYPPGVLVAREPEQIMVEGDMPSFQKDGFTLKPLAIYEIDARVLHTRRYALDATAKIAPYDFAVGWGPMSDQSVLDGLKISQGNRFYFYEWRNTPPIAKDEIACHSANMHLIPANWSVKWDMWRTGAGDLIRMKGLLVEVSGPDLSPWRSSLSRTDTGNGACEIMWVQSLEKLKDCEAVEKSAEAKHLSQADR